MTYGMKCALALDLFVNALTDGNLGETISARVQRASDAHHGWRGIYRYPAILLAKLLVGGLNFLQAHHGIYAEEGDAARAELVQAIESEALARQGHLP